MSDQPRRRRRRHHKVFPIKTVILCLLAVVALIFFLISFLRFLSLQAKEQAQAQPQVSSSPTETPAPSTPSPSPQPSASAAYDFSLPVPETTPVDESYLDDAVFIGDSRTEGLILYTGLTNTTGFTYKGLMVDTVFTKPVINQGGQMVTVIDALKATQFSKVYIMLGINELGWSYPKLFIEKYQEILTTIRDINPNATIYIQEILPVTQEVSDTHSYISNARISEYNQMLKELAQENQVYYLQVSQAVADSNGCLPDDAASDGIHLSPAYCQKWLDYLLCHTVTP